MARTISDEQIKLSVIIDGNPAQKELHETEKAIRNLNKQQTELRKEKQALERAGQKESARYKEITQAMRENTTAITANKTRMEQLQREIGLTGLTMAQLRSKATALRATLNNLIPGSADYQRYDAELRQVNARISELRGNAQAARFSIGSLADSFNRYAALGASVIAGLTGVVLSVQKVIDMNGKLSDAQSDVMKTTGATKEEVDELTKSFGLMKTRTARIELLDLATEAGRLGIEGVDNIKAFVEQANKMKVALGDDLSDEAIREVGKMVNVYKVGDATGKDFAGSMDALGSAINEVSASGANQAGFLVDYLKRQAGIAAQAKLSAADNIAYAATFDEIGQSVEVSATAMNKVWMDMFQNPAQYAKIARMSVADFNKLLAEDSNAAMIKFLDGLKGNDEGLKMMLESMKDLEVGGARGVQALAALANNTDLLKKRQDISNQALQEATSLTNEYNLKNENLQATIEKLQKRIAGMFSSEGFINWLSNAVGWFAKFIGATEDADGKVTAWRNTLVFIAKVIAIVTAALITNVAWQKLVAMWTTRNTQATLLYNIASKARAVADGIVIVTTQALAAAQMLLTLNLKGAAQAFRVMTATMMTTPWGFILGAVAAIGAAYIAFRKEAESLTAVQKVLNEVQLEATQSIAKEKNELELLTKIAKDESIEKEKRQKAIEKLNKISPEYLGNLTLENIKTLEGTELLRKYTEELYKNAKAKAAQAKFDELSRKRLEVESKTTADISTTGKSIGKFFGQGDGPQFSSRKDVEKYVLENFSEFVGKRTEETTGVTLVDSKKFKMMVDKYIQSSGLNIKEAELADIDAQMKALEAELLKGTLNDLGSPIQEELPCIDLSGDKTKGKKYDDSYLDQERRMREELLKLRQKTEEERIAILGEGYAKELELEIAKQQARIQNHNQETENIKHLQEKLQKDLIEAQKNGDTKKVASIKNMQQILGDKQAELNKQLQYQEEIHHLKLGTIQEKAGRASVQREKEQYELEKTARETAFLEELASLDISEKEKTKLKEKFAKEELAKEEEMLQRQISKIQQITQGVEVDGVQFNLLSDEDKNKLLNDIALLENALAKLRNAKNNPEGEGEEKELDLGVNTDADILGFTQEQWDRFFQNIDNGTVGIQTMQMAISAAQQLWSQFDQYMTASENAQIRNYEKNQDSRKRALKRQLDNGQINQVQYKRKVEEMDQELDRKKAEIEYKQAKRQRLMSIANVITSTAQAIMSIWAQVPKFDFGATAGILTGMVSAMGALQLGTILKTPLPAKGYEQGLYPEYVEREQDGKMFKAGFGGKTKSGMVNKPTYFLAGENYKPEMVIDNKAYRDLSPYTRNLLINELRGIKGFENGYYNQEAMRIEVPAQAEPMANDSNSQANDLMIALMSENISLLKDLRDNGVIGYFTNKDMRSMKEIKEGIERYNEIRTKSKM